MAPGNPCLCWIKTHLSRSWFKGWKTQRTWRFYPPEWVRSTFRGATILHHWFVYVAINQIKLFTLTVGATYSVFTCEKDPYFGLDDFQRIHQLTFQDFPEVYATISQICKVEHIPDFIRWKMFVAARGFCCISVFSLVRCWLRQTVCWSFVRQWDVSIVSAWQWSRAVTVEMLQRLEAECACASI